jgi:hypothetical protein
LPHLATGTDLAIVEKETLMILEIIEFKVVPDFNLDL